MTSVKIICTALTSNYPWPNCEIKPNLSLPKINATTHDVYAFETSAAVALRIHTKYIKKINHIMDCQNLSPEKELDLQNK